MERICEEKEIESVLLEFDPYFYITMGQMRIDAKSWANKIAKKGIAYVRKDGLSKHNIGLLIFYANDVETNISFLTSITVKKEYQGQHIGDEILCFWLGYAKLLGFKFGRLEVNKNNYKAVRFYKKHGFELEGWNDDSYFFKKRLE